MALDNTYLCPTCRVKPVRKTDGEMTHLECPLCDLRSGEINLIRDDFAFHNTRALWNRLVLEKEGRTSVWDGPLLAKRGANA